MPKAVAETPWRKIGYKPCALPCKNICSAQLLYYKARGHHPGRKSAAPVSLVLYLPDKKAPACALMTTQ